MSAEERRLIKCVDDEVLSATPERLEELQELDIETQMSGVSFYENAVNSGILENARMMRATRRK